MLKRESPIIDTTAPNFDAAFRHQLEALLGWRRDVRHFRVDALPDGTIDDLLRLASLAPSVGNAQPWRFVRIITPGLREALAAHVDGHVAQAGGRYAPGAQADLYAALKLHGLREAPEILAVFCDDDPDAGHGLGIATMQQALHYSVVLAIHTLWLAARARGIGLGWVSILDPLEVAAMLSVPADWTLIGLLCLGYPQAGSDVPELERRGWQGREDWRLSVFAC
jgi:5,6-dimethylbenzimidazole synthase